MKMITSRFGRMLLLFTGLGLVAGVQACKKDTEEETQALVAVEAEQPEVGEIAEHITADATLAPLAQATISPRITAPVRAFYVQRGSRVKAGQLLAVLENRDLTAQAQDSRGQLIAARAGYDLQAKAQVPEDQAKAQFDTTQAKAQLDLQNAVVNQRQKLFQQGAIAGRDLDTAVAQQAQARSSYETALNHLNALQQVGSQAVIQQSQGQLESAKGKYAAAEAQIEYSRIRSPISGIVTDRPLFPGETATQGSALLTVMDTSSLLAKVHLSQAIAQRLSPGDEADVLVPGVETPVKAKVSLVSPALDPGSTTVEVWLRVANASGEYKVGTPVRTSVEGRRTYKAIKLPLSAVLTADDGTKSVLVVKDDSKAHKAPIEIGINDGKDVQVTKGLTGGETVITNGAYGLAEGTKVKIRKPETSEGDDK